MISVKICGIRDRAAMDAAIEGGAAMAGLMFYAPSPRAIDLMQAADLADHAAGRIALVGVFVDADDDHIARTLRAVPLTHLQLHGRESPERVTEIAGRFGLPAIKAVGIGNAADVSLAHTYEPVADTLLFDARPPTGHGHLPGGNALSFDWRLIARENWGKPWMLSGGLAADNVAEAIKASGARAVDVSSGVESSRGVKDPALIRAFLAAVSRLETPDRS